MLSNDKYYISQSLILGAENTLEILILKREDEL